MCFPMLSSKMYACMFVFICMFHHPDSYDLGTITIKFKAPVPQFFQFNWTTHTHTMNAVVPKTAPKHERLTPACQKQ